MKFDRLSRSILSAGSLVFLLLAPMITLASDDLDVTMRMVTDDVELTDSVVREIELPRVVERPETAAEPGSKGLEASRGGRDAREVRERGREFGEAVSESARQTRDLMERDLLEEGRPDRPDRREGLERPQRPELPDAAGRER
ncbi:hypothetical protein [Marinobacter subterrani]|uniref:Uncharacterized protein n=1 Tax=Marinobacter subterrani TaxID=1658765 RepID=A0A0J7J4D2_9GAMM|nr:hypothetical protein [Marinobacter subterrani]KMQ73463.1 hypothetical protein Msub_20664 [Marinobacter subterrani]